MFTYPSSSSNKPIKRHKTERTYMYSDHLAFPNSSFRWSTSPHQWPQEMAHLHPNAPPKASPNLSGPWCTASDPPNDHLIFLGESFPLCIFQSVDDRPWTSRQVRRRPRRSAYLRDYQAWFPWALSSRVYSSYSSFQEQISSRRSQDRHAIESVISLRRMIARPAFEYFYCHCREGKPMALCYTSLSKLTWIYIVKEALWNPSKQAMTPQQPLYSPGEGPRPKTAPGVALLPNMDSFQRCLVDFLLASFTTCGPMGWAPFIYHLRHYSAVAHSILNIPLLHHSMHQTHLRKSAMI